MRHILLLSILFGMCRHTSVTSRRHRVHHNYHEGMATKIAHAANVIAPRTDCVEPPQECPNANITFSLHTKYGKVPLTEEVLRILGPSFVNVTHPWKMTLHGYKGCERIMPSMEVIRAYFKKGDYNFIVGDYAPLVEEGCYMTAVRNVPLLANCTAQILDILVEKGLLKLSNLHIIGFSLGAHVAGRIYEYLSKGKPGRITGLDPAFPLFDGIVNHELTRKSAKFVDAIHTNALVMGKFAAKSHVDFYVNGGTLQTACWKYAYDFNYFWKCNHGISVYYFTESIRSQVGFWGVSCSFFKFMFTSHCTAKMEDLVQMGDPASKKSRGVYYLQANRSAPFAMGKQTSVWFQI